MRHLLLAAVVHLLAPLGPPLPPAAVVPRLAAAPALLLPTAGVEHLAGRAMPAAGPPAHAGGGGALAAHRTPQAVQEAHGAARGHHAGAYGGADAAGAGTSHHGGAGLRKKV